MTTEDGFVQPPPFRFIAHFFLGYHKTLDDYQRARATLARNTGSQH